MCVHGLDVPVVLFAQALRHQGDQFTKSLRRRLRGFCQIQLPVVFNFQGQGDESHTVQAQVFL